MEETIVENKNKFYAIVAGAAILALIFVAGVSYFLGAQSKNDQLEACAKTMTAIENVVSYDGEYSAEDVNNLEKCDPSYR